MNLVKATGTIGGLTLVSRIAGFGREMLMSRVMGASDAADAFLVSFRLPNTFRRLFGEGAFSAGFVPLFSQRLHGEGGEADAKQFSEEVLAVFLPTLIIYVPIHIIAGLPVDQHLLWLIPLIFLMFVMAAGAGMLVSALQVYFRDVKNFLPYFLRVWLYSSPVLYYADEVPNGLGWILYVNPLGGLLTAWSDVLIFGANPEPWAIGMAAVWAFGIFLAGGLFFISREREFAVRL